MLPENQKTKVNLKEHMVCETELYKYCFHFFLTLVLAMNKMLRQMGRPDLDSGRSPCPKQMLQCQQFPVFGRYEL